ncbi:hypothetical protein [uncultured Kiloniella sp.]|uniref:hypothetical protein n=1 Tax=uncultured Kiloniella sp. TaxID=1133091 RepID=UPI00261EEFDF|nr:hypothetical protein [uncultured Kiloniella sp.]
MDTVEHRKIITDELNYKEKSKYFKAFSSAQRPLFSQKVDNDTLYLSADTLISANPSDTLNYIMAIRDVKIFKSDLQAISDSLYYSDVDSMFRLFLDPVCWSDTTQFSGDTISLQLTNDAVSDIYVDKNAFIATLDMAEYYNQIKGKKIHAILDSSELVQMNTKGNAESIYFLKDSDDKYVGANKNLCSHMTFNFKDEEMVNTIFYTEPENTMVPMGKATNEDLFLTGFTWREAERPRSFLELRVISKSQQIANPSGEGNDPFEAEVNKVFLNDKQIKNDKKQ